MNLLDMVSIVPQNASFSYVVKHPTYLVKELSSPNFDSSISRANATKMSDSSTRNMVLLPGSWASGYETVNLLINLGW
jgi:hypothetical protein